MDSGLADGLVLSYTDGFSEPTLEFLQHWAVSRVVLFQYGLSPIYRLGETLERLGGRSAAKVLDLARLPRLQYFSGDFRQVRASISAAENLVTVELGNYGGDHLVPLAASVGLTEIGMWDRPRLTSLNGVASFSCLRRLRVAGASRLTDITAPAGATHLSQLDLDSARRVTDIAPRGAHRLDPREHRRHRRSGLVRALAGPRRP